MSETTINEARLAGFLCADAILDERKNPRLIFRLANNRSEKHPTFMSCVAWQELASRNANLKLGDAVSVTGYIRTSSWEKNGTKMYGTEIVCDSITVISTKADKLLATNGQAPAAPEAPTAPEVKSDTEKLAEAYELMKKTGGMRAAAKALKQETPSELETSEVF